MHTSVVSSVSAGLIVAVTGAAVAAPPPPPIAPAPTSANIRLMADPVPVGGLVTSFLGNQLTYCSIICPDIVKLAVTVPVGAAVAPLAFVAGLGSGNPLKAVGALVASVTNPLNAAFDPIITNDLNLVLPRAQNALEVGVVGLLNIAAAGPGGLLPAIQTARQNTFDALNDTIPPTQTAPHPRGLVQVVAVEAINVASSVLFQAFEEGLLGIVQTADAAATALARTGDLVAAFVAGEKAAFTSFGKTIGYIVTAATTAVTNIAAALRGPLTRTSQITTRDAEVAVTATPRPDTAESTGNAHGDDETVAAHDRDGDKPEVLGRHHDPAPPENPDLSSRSASVVGSPDDGDSGGQEGQQPSGEEQRPGWRLAGSTLAGLPDPHDGAHRQQDDRLDDDLGVVGVEPSGPRGSQDDAREEQHQQAVVHQGGEREPARSRLGDPGSEHHGKADDMQQHDDTA